MLLKISLACGQPKTATSQNFPQDTAKVKLFIGKAAELLYSDTKAALFNANEALRISNELHFLFGQARAHNVLGVIANLQGKYSEAAGHYFKAVEIFEKLRQENGVAKVYTNLATVCVNERKLDLALEYYQKALKIQNQRKDTAAVANVLSNLGTAYYHSKQDSLALQSYTGSMSLLTKLPINAETLRLKVANLINIAMIFMDKKEYTKADKQFENCLQLCRITENKFLEMYIYISQAEIYLQTSRPLQALQVSRSGLDIAIALNHKKHIVDFYSVMSKAYTALKLFPEAYRYQSLSLLMADTLKTVTNRSKIDKVVYGQTIKKIQAEISILENRFNSNEALIKVIICLAIVLSVTSIWYALFRYKKHLNSKESINTLTQQKAEINFLQDKISEKAKSLELLNDQLDQAKKDISTIAQIEQFNKVLESNIINGENWEQFKTDFEVVYPLFFTNLRYHFPKSTFTIADFRLSALIRLNLSLKECGKMLNVSPDSVKQSRYRLKRKLGLAEDETLEDVMKKISYHGLN